MTLEAEIKALAQEAKQASSQLALTSTEQRNAGLRAMAAALRDATTRIIEANGRDVQAAQEQSISEALIDRLQLDEGRIEAMASALEDLVELPDPVGVVHEQRTLYNGLELTRVSVPLGVVAVIYEARPNVTADAAGICLKSGNACVLRGGSLAAHSNEVIATVLAQAAQDAGLPEHSIVAITTTDRAAADILMSLRGVIDVLVPRGGAGLINHCVEHSSIPVIETGTGNCHVYVHHSANEDQARAIIVNAKCRRLGVCNAAETLLVDKTIADSFLPATLAELIDWGIQIHGDEMVCALGAEAGLTIVPATVEDWETEYLGPHLAVKCVEGLEEAIDHINTYGTHHSESIVAEEDAAIERFLAEVDAAAVYANASTAFTDGGQFGLGAEIGISTQKLHTRGPFATDALTTYKYLIRGNGQVRTA